MPSPPEVRLLIVDDHPMVREGLRARLQAVPHIQVVGEAGGVAAALMALSACAPTVALLDVGLKDGNGIELARALLQQQPALRVLMFSMYDNPEYVQRALQVGASGYVLKDAPASEIVAAIDAVAAGCTFLSPAVSRQLFRGQAPKPLLSPREAEVLAGVGRGESSKQMARALGLSVRTIETHRQNIKRKLDLNGQAELIRYAVERSHSTLPREDPS
jgi:DNA-binding NarL/FixJ family response regulator